MSQHKTWELCLYLYIYEKMPLGVNRVQFEKTNKPQTIFLAVVPETINILN